MNPNLPLTLLLAALLLLLCLPYLPSSATASLVIFEPPAVKVEPGSSAQVRLIILAVGNPPEPSLATAPDGVRATLTPLGEGDAGAYLLRFEVSERATVGEYFIPVKVGGDVFHFRLAVTAPTLNPYPPVGAVEAFLAVAAVSALISALFVWRARGFGG